MSEVVHRLIMDSGLVDYYRERDKSDGTEKVGNLEELINATAEYPATMEGLSLFLESLMLGASEEDPFSRTEKVTLITAHNTKGLEFDRVFITGLEDGIFPHYSSTVRGLPVAGSELEEERRLFYVGMTRARKRLFCSYANMRRRMGMIEGGTPSRFLYEIPEELLDGAVDAFIQDAQRQGVEKVVVRMVAGQEAARKICERLGFRVDAVLPDHIKDAEGKLHAQVVMSCTLDELWRELKDFHSADDWPDG